jgi:hypothetical protein
MPGWLKWTLIGLGAVAVLAIFVSFFRADTEHRDVSFAEILNAGRSGTLERIEVRGRQLDVTFTNESDEFESRIGANVDLVAALQAEGIAIGGADGVEIEFESSANWGGFLPLFLNFLPLVAFLFVMYFVLRNAVREGMRRAREDERASQA